MSETFSTWLQKRPCQATTINSQVARVCRVERYCGGLDEHYKNDRMSTLLDTLHYSTYDEGHHRPNPSRIPIHGDIRKGLASCRGAAMRYKEFRDAHQNGSDGVRRPVALVDGPACSGLTSDLRRVPVSLTTTALAVVTTR